MISRRDSANVQPKALEKNNRIDVNWKWPSASGKENVNPATQVSKFKTVADLAKDKVIQDVKINASKTFLNVKSSLDNFSQKLRRSTRKRCSPTMSLRYEELNNKPLTPVKLYSPFGITTPSPNKMGNIATTVDGKKSRCSRRFSFVSPTGKLRKDIDDLSNGLRELNTIANSLKKRHNIKYDK